jgi:hypothetical protein
MVRKRKNSSWESCTWTGARREQLRRWSKLSLRKKLQAVEAMGKVAERFAKLRRSSTASVARNQKVPEI